MHPAKGFITTATLAGLSWPKVQVDTQCVLWATQNHVLLPANADQWYNNFIHPEISSDDAWTLAVEDPAVTSVTNLLQNIANDMHLLQYLKSEEHEEDPFPRLVVSLPPYLVKWREEDNIRLFLDFALLCGVSPGIVAEDFRKLWGFNVTPDQIIEYARLFADITEFRGTGQLNYEAGLQPAQIDLLHGIVRQPSDFVRWRLGVPLAQDPEQVLDKLASDAYYTIALLKRRAGNLGIDLAPNDLARIKLERDTIFKAIDRKLKMKQSGEGEESNDLKSIKEILGGFEVEAATMTTVNATMRKISDLK
jgi:hypothetical protein